MQMKDKPSFLLFSQRIMSWQERMSSKCMFFWNYFFLWIVTLEASIWKTKLDGMFIFRCWFFENFSFWPIKSADLQDSGPKFKIWTRWRLHNHFLKIGIIFACNSELIFVRTYQLWDSCQTWKMMLFVSAQYSCTLSREIKHPGLITPPPFLRKILAAKPRENFGLFSYF